MNTIFQQKHNTIFNVVLWCLYYLILLLIFSKGKAPQPIDYVYTAGFFVFLLIPIVIVTYVFVPKLLQHEKYILFGITFTGICVVFGQLYVWYFDELMDVIFPNYYFISYQTDMQAITKLALFLVVSVLMQVFVSWLNYNADRNRILQLENQRIQQQLTNLRSQINPHFLFNSLNVIYALAIEKKEETQDAIVQLSDVLRYIIYDADSDRIQLKDEIKLLKNFIAFQKFRTRGLEEINFDIAVEDETFQIYPMLFLPLVENAFKHGINTRDEKGYIQLSLTQKQHTCIFQIENSIQGTPQKTVDNYSGVGLENVKNNLEIVYPNQHEFQVEKRANSFVVSITITNKKT